MGSPSSPSAPPALKTQKNQTPEEGFLAMVRKGQKVSMKTERDILRVGRLPLERFQNEQLAALTIYAIYWLREWGIRPTVEAIAVASHRLFPERFAMDLF